MKPGKREPRRGAASDRKPSGNPDGDADQGRRCPPGLCAAAQRAFRRAQGFVDDPERFYDVAVTYARAVDREWRLRGEWKDAGCPATTMGGTRGQTVIAHPLVKAMADAGASVLEASRVLGLDPAARKAVGGRSAGRPQGTDLPPALPARPSDRLRAV